MPCAGVLPLHDAFAIHGEVVLVSWYPDADLKQAKDTSLREVETIGLTSIHFSFQQMTPNDASAFYTIIAFYYIFTSST